MYEISKKLQKINPIIENFGIKAPEFWFRFVEWTALTGGLLYLTAVTKSLIANIALHISALLLSLYTTIQINKSVLYRIKDHGILKNVMSLIIYVIIIVLINNFINELVFAFAAKF